MWLKGRSTYKEILPVGKYVLLKVCFLYSSTPYIEYQHVKPGLYKHAANYVCVCVTTPEIFSVNHTCSWRGKYLVFCCMTVISTVLSMSMQAISKEIQTALGLYITLTYLLFIYIEHLYLLLLMKPKSIS